MAEEEWGEGGGNSSTPPEGTGEGSGTSPDRRRGRRGQRRFHRGGRTLPAPAATPEPANYNDDPWGMGYSSRRNSDLDDWNGRVISSPDDTGRYDSGSDKSWWEDEIVPQVSTPVRYEPKPHSRRTPRRTRIIAGVAAAALAAGAGVGAAKVLGGGREQHSARPAAAASASPGHTEHLRPSDPDVVSLEQDYQESHAVFQPGREPFAIGLTPAQQTEYHMYKNRLDHGKVLTYSDLRKYEILQLKAEVAAPEVAKAQELAEKYDASFAGKVELSTGQKVNFFIINNKSDRTVTIDAKALDAYFQWSIAHLADVYQPDGKGDDSARLAKIAQYQALAKNGKLGTTISIFLNPTPNECFTQQDSIVPEEITKTISTGNGTTGTETYTNPSCLDLGFNFSGVGTPVVIGLNAINTMETRATEKDPNGPARPISINGLAATLAVLMHEGVGHTAAQGNGLFPNGGEQDPKNGFSQDHLQMTNPLTNFVIDFLKGHTPGINGIPSFPIQISKRDAALAP